jgi:hypothetical protein
VKILAIKVLLAVVILAAGCTAKVEKPVFIDTMRAEQTSLEVKEWMS